LPRNSGVLAEKKLATKSLIHKGSQKTSRCIKPKKFIFYSSDFPNTELSASIKSDISYKKCGIIYKRCGIFYKKYNILYKRYGIFYKKYGKTFKEYGIPYKECNNTCNEYNYPYK